MPYFAAYAGKRMYDQLTPELRNMFTSLPPGTVTFSTLGPQQTHFETSCYMNPEVRESSMQRGIKRDVFEIGMWMQLPYLCLARQPLFLRRNGKAGLADCCFMFVYAYNGALAACGTVFLAPLF